MITPITYLKGHYPGSTIYVVASGKSMDYIPKSFFGVEKIIIGVNQVYRDIRCDYVLMHHGEDGQRAIDDGQALVCSEFHCGHTSWGRNLFRGDYSTYAHAENQQTRGIDLKALDSEDRLAISACTTAEAVHLAAYMGATTIILCGADSGRLDGELNYAGYNDGGPTNPTHIPMTEPLLILLVNELRKRGVTILSLNPFINPGMEGHIYSRPPKGTVYVSGSVVDAFGNKVASITPPIGVEVTPTGVDMGAQDPVEVEAASPEGVVPLTLVQR